MGSTGTGGVPKTTGPGHVVYKNKEGMFSLLQTDLGGLKSCFPKYEEFSCGKVSRHSLEFQRTDLGQMGRSYEEVDFGLA